MPRRMVGLECVLATLAAPVPRRSASGLDALIRRVSQTVDDEVLYRLMCLQGGLEHDLGGLLDLAVCFGLDHHCRRSAGSPVLLGSAGGSSELPSVSLLLCVPLGGPLARARVPLLSVACGVLDVEQAGHSGSLGSSELEG